VESGGSAVFVDQPVQDGFSADSLDIEVDCCDAGNFALIAGNLLGNALMRPGRVVVDLVLDQDGAQMRLASASLVRSLRNTRTARAATMRTIR